MNYNNITNLKIALINSPSPFLIDDKVMPPLGIMYLSSYIKEYVPNVEVKIIDLASINQEIPNNFDIYAFTSTTPQYTITLNLMKELKQKNQRSTFVIGGAHASCFKSKCQDDGFDCIIIGEGEKALTDICKFKISHQKDNTSISGIFKSKHIQNIDTIPFPDRTFEGFTTYNYTINNEKATTAMSSRGCPFNCHFCCNMWGNDVRLMSSSKVIEEAKEIQNLGFDSIMYFDDTFSINKKRVIDICKGLKDLGITWRCFIHANTVDYNLLSIMKDSGCAEAGVGVESGSDKILNTVNKKIDINRAIEVCNQCHEVGIRIKTFLMIGLPSESKDTVEQTIKFIEQAKPDDFDYTIYTPFPNTEIWNNKEKFDIQFNKETLDYSKMFYKGIKGKYKAQISTSNLSSEDIELLRDEVESLKGIYNDKK